MNDSSLLPVLLQFNQIILQLIKHQSCYFYEVIYLCFLKKILFLKKALSTSILSLANHTRQINLRIKKVST